MYKIEQKQQHTQPRQFINPQHLHNIPPPLVMFLPWEAAGFGRETVDHGFEAHVDIAGADDFGDVYWEMLILVCWTADETRNWKKRTAGIVGLQKGNFDAFICETSQFISGQGRQPSFIYFYVSLIK